MIIVRILERYVKTGAVRMEFVHEAYATVCLDISEKIVLKQFAQLTNILIQQTIHVDSTVHQALTKISFHERVSLVKNHVKHASTNQQYAHHVLLRLIIHKFTTKHCVTASAQ